jgi:hypothetical protein
LEQGIQLKKPPVEVDSAGGFFVDFWGARAYNLNKDSSATHPKGQSNIFPWPVNQDRLASSFFCSQAESTMQTVSCLPKEKEIMSSNSDRFPNPNNRILFAVTPGLLATLGLINGNSSFWTLLGVILLLLFVAVAWLKNNRRLPGWSLMAIGLLLGIAQPVVLGIIGVLVALVTGTPPSPASSPFVLALPWIGIAVLSLYLKQDRKASSRTWLLAAVIVLCCILVRVKYFILLGVSWSILWEMLGVSLWSAGTLLLPIIAVGPLARRYGAPTSLFAVGAIFAWYQVLIDNAYKVSGNIGSSELFWVYLIVVRFLFIVIGPWLFLRAKGTRRQLFGLIGSICASVAINIMISGIVRGDFTLIIWLTAIPYTISIGLSLALAYWLYWSAGNSKNNTSIKQPANTGAAD